MFTMIRQRSVTTVPAHPADVIGLDDIAARGEAGWTHRWTHHLVLPGEDEAVVAAIRLEAQGWTVERLSAMPSPFPGWALRVFRDTVVDVPGLDAARDVFEAVAADGRGQYGGWDVHTAPRHAVVG